MPARGPRMSAARCSARYSNSGDSACSGAVRARRRDYAMSRVGKKPVEVPNGVTVNVDGQNVTAKGPKGQLALRLVDDVEASMQDGKVEVKPRGDTKRARSMWGMQRTLINNLLVGVSEGF